MWCRWHVIAPLHDIDDIMRILSACLQSDKYSFFFFFSVFVGSIYCITNSGRVDGDLQGECLNPMLLNIVRVQLKTCSSWKCLPQRCANSLLPSQPCLQSPRSLFTNSIHVFVHHETSVQKSIPTKLPSSGE
ncbi:hypothetical protein BR93DRAFT_268024 [Coniochaeta sp. PMI_546]|nr:hypothetical protein BR93DRAFT_268024 [Coniochaeta sp. PMI_546]